ncbi:hypothetical protein ACP70R_013814 [Stipagrostis hirtigluma subsp. patula]
MQGRARPPPQIPIPAPSSSFSVPLVGLSLPPQAPTPPPHGRLEPLKSLFSGFYTLYCIKNFDGKNIRNEPNQESFENFTEYMLYEVFSLKLNQVKKPTEHIESIDD